MLITVCLSFLACHLPLHVCVLLHGLFPPSTHTRKHEHTNTQHTELRSKSLEEDKKDRRISWGVDGEEEENEGGKRQVSEELKHRRHTVAGDTRESR